jgi:hypothetical protein
VKSKVASALIADTQNPDKGRGWSGCFICAKMERKLPITWPAMAPLSCPPKVFYYSSLEAFKFNNLRASKLVDLWRNPNIAQKSHKHKLVASE